MRAIHGPSDPTQSWRIFSIAFLVLVVLLMLATATAR